MLTVRNFKNLVLSSKFFLWGHEQYIKYTNRNRRIYRKYKRLFKDKSGIEIGGKSFIFSVKGPTPFYTIIKQLDNINFNNKTFWGDFNEGENFYFIDNKTGKQIIADATDLSVIRDNSYDFVLSSHVIEHIANPIKALYEWKRIIKSAGYLFIVAPNMKDTYDRNRSLTSLDHVITDFKNRTVESDTTHFDEVINLHDFFLDSTVNSIEDHVQRTLDNINTRIVHHHTFHMGSLSFLLKYCDYQIIDKQFVKPYHLMIIAQKK